MTTLPKKWQDYLTKEPETGMGYHAVTIVMNNGNTLYNRKVLNSEVIYEDIDTDAIKDIIILL